MSKVKPYKKQDIPEQLANEPMMAYNKQEAVAQRISVEVPSSDVAFFKELVKKMGWNLVLGNHLSAKKENVSRRFVIDQLCGAVHLPADFDYKKELEDTVRTKYL
ncbi:MULTISPECIES: hypothetical protein [Bacteroides]|uniref:hypothetical protein n=1 Tax=Bacteroides TaxID=816 RepID=UPI000E431BA9|nr:MULTISPECIES: hypothetical protein [Bacteroides]RGM45294.1 hypothetical protein DXC10_14185 [Bacteroides sp. OM08-11]